MIKSLVKSALGRVGLKLERIAPKKAEYIFDEEGLRAYQAAAGVSLSTIIHPSAKVSAHVLIDERVQFVCAVPKLQVTP